MVENKRLRVWPRILWASICLLIVFIIGFVAWASISAKPMPEALTALRSDSKVTVETGRWLVFSPLIVRPTTGLIIYPGGRVDPRAYSPAALAIADQGYLVVIVPMPLNLAVFNSSAASDVIAAHPEIQTWAMAGHSLGGSMAASFAHAHPGTVHGLVLWASYPAGMDDLSGSGLKVLSISATLDGLSTPAKIDASRALLPLDTTFLPIQGGDHAQFGWYGPQAGDNPATISRKDQQNQIIQATLDFLADLK
jgi:hypothetical protein